MTRSRSLRSGGILLSLVGTLLVAVGGTALVLRRRQVQWITRLTATIPGAHDYWRERGRAHDGAVLYVAVGDSAALGIGASSPAGGYVGIVADAIAEETGRPVRVRNLAIDGATLAVCILDELPRLAALEPDVCTLSIGANDIWSFEPERFRRELAVVLDAMPPGTIVAELPSFSVIPVHRRVAAANRIIRAEVAERGFVLAPLHRTTSAGGALATVFGSAGDLFHPNDRGYVRWAAAFLPAVREALERLTPSAG
ncbi:SGNH/GDSL hydrolase family protein [uncultured Amnibacterium sp.]|uniref:SGNH/GDSL hydrolase family protein n=1 Tax=uncultured Amnibacterium sp. TaxID=1631851 RepID=UPI0035CA73B9